MGNVENFFKYARDRYQLMLDREADFEQPWTKDPIFQEFRFCNVFREDDRTTKWIRENIRTPMHNHPRLLFAMVVARWFNRIETLNELKSQCAAPGVNIKNMFMEWDSDEVRHRLKDQHPLITGAYMVKTPAGMNKLEGLIWCLEQILPDAEHLQARIEDGETTLEEVTAVLAEYPFLGPFMSYEIVTDLRHTPLLDKAPDIMTWANPGPGAARGLGRVMRGNKDFFNRSSKKDQEPLQRGMQFLLKQSQRGKNWPKRWPTWEMRDVEHLLCEMDKYERARLGEGRPKQKFKPFEEK